MKINGWVPLWTSWCLGPFRQWLGGIGTFQTNSLTFDPTQGYWNGLDPLLYSTASNYLFHCYWFPLEKEKKLQVAHVICLLFLWEKWKQAYGLPPPGGCLHRLSDYYSSPRPPVRWCLWWPACSAAATGLRLLSWLGPWWWRKETSGQNKTCGSVMTEKPLPGAP